MSRSFTIIGSCHARLRVVLLATFVLFSIRADTEANPALVDIKSVDPSIVINLRYATPNNITGRRLYPAGTRALILPTVAQQLAGAQRYLRSYHYGLAIWDAYRPKEAQVLLWK